MAYLNEELKQKGEEIKSEFPDFNLSETDAENLALSTLEDDDMGLKDDDDFWDLIEDENS